MKVIRSISTILLAMLVLVSSTSFIVGMHFCMGDVQNIALFSKAESCKIEKALPPCHKNMKPACCDDELVYHEGTDFKASVVLDHIDAPVPTDVEQAVILISEIIPAAPRASIRYFDYDPPLRSYDLTLEHQVFLI